jgi:hypothetical protein
LDFKSIESSVNERDKRSAGDTEDNLKDQKGFKVLTALNDKREGIETPIEALRSEDIPVESNRGETLRSNVDQPAGGSGGITNNVQENSESNSQQGSAAGPSQSHSGSNKDTNEIGEKRGDVSSSERTQKVEESKSQSTTNSGNAKQDNSASSAPVKDKNNDKGISNDTGHSVNSPKQGTQDSQKSQAAPSSVTIQGNTVNGRPLASSSSSPSPEPVKDPLGNSGSEVVTSHRPYEDQSENDQFPYRDARSKSESKESSEPEVGHFQVDDKSADLEINANSAGVKVKAKPASLQVVSRPGAHPSTPIVPIAPIHPYYHHYPHYHHYFDAYRRSMRPYHRRLYNNPYHAHYR